MTKFKHNHVLVLIFLLSVFLLNIFKIRDTDTWMHLSIGKLIWNLKGLPMVEPLVYTTPDRPFYYASWLFGVIYYLVYSALGAYGLTIFKAFTVTAGFYTMLTDSLRPYRNYAVAVIVMAGVVYMSKSRFVERPDTFLMVFLPCNIFFINSYIRDNSKYIYALPLINMIWANCHATVPALFLVFPAYIVGGMLQLRLSNKGRQYPDTPSMPQIKVLGLVFAASFAATLINPFFLKQYLYSNVLISPWAKHRILEFLNPVWPFNKTPFILAAAVLLSFLLNRRRFSLIHVMLLLPFIVLSFKARRLIFVAGIVSGPVIVQNISSFLELRSLEVFFRKKIMTAAVAVSLIGFTYFAMFRDDPLNIEKKIFGLGVNYSVVPEGALRYMDEKGITGRVFNVLSMGGYINWRDYPKRTVFVDPRFHLPEELLVKMDLAWERPDVMDELQRRYGFDSILGNYPLIIRTTLLDDIFHERDPLISIPGWALVYWDDFSLVYLKKGGRFGNLIEAGEYLAIRPGNSIIYNRARLHDRTYCDAAITELKRNIRESGSLKGIYSLGYLYNEVGLHNEAIEVLSKALGHAGEKPEYLYSSMAYALSNVGRTDDAIDYYKKSIALKEDAAVIYRLGLCYFEGRGDRRTAFAFFRRAQELNPYLTSPYRMLMSFYSGPDYKDELAVITGLYDNARKKQDGDAHLRKAQNAFMVGNFGLAFPEFEAAIRSNPSNPVLYSMIAYAAFDFGDMDMAYQYHKMAADIDPDFADAYYGLALILNRWGDKEAAGKNIEKYLRLEPNGLFSAEAREYLKSLEKRK